MNTTVGNDKGETRTADGRKRLGKNRDGETNGKRDERNNGTAWNDTEQHGTT
jgi:hypothetical protein